MRIILAGTPGPYDCGAFVFMAIPCADTCVTVFCSGSFETILQLYLFSPSGFCDFIGSMSYVVGNARGNA